MSGLPSAAQAAAGAATAMIMMAAGLTVFIIAPLLVDVAAGHAAWWRSLAERVRVARSARRMRRWRVEFPERDWSDTAPLVRVSDHA